MPISENSFVVRGGATLKAFPYWDYEEKILGVPEDLGDFWPLPFWLSLMSFAFLNW